MLNDAGGLSGPVRQLIRDFERFECETVAMVGDLACQPPPLASLSQPPTPTDDHSFTNTKRFLTGEAGRMKTAGEIPEGVRITDFAKRLEARMKTAAKTDASLRAVTWRYIKNQLPAWDLWPVSKINSNIK
jgi:hypothetical protein